MPIFSKKFKDWLVQPRTHNQIEKDFKEKIESKIEITAPKIQGTKINWQKWGVIIALISLAVAVLGIAVNYFINHGGDTKENLGAPVLFKYDYSADLKLFSVTSDSDVQITKADWVLASDWISSSSPIFNKTKELLKINDFPSKLSRGTLEDSLSWIAGINILTEVGKDLLECILLPHAQDGVPVLIAITYNQPNKGESTEKNLALLVRLDTPYPEIVPGPQNVTDNAEIFNYFNKYLYSLDFAIKQVREYEKKIDTENYSGQLKYDGRCSFQINQPINGY